MENSRKKVIKRMRAFQDANKMSDRRFAIEILDCSPAMLCLFYQNKRNFKPVKAKKIAAIVGANFEDFF